MSQPTPEDVKRIICEFECNTDVSALEGEGFPVELYDEILNLGDAYLAQGEELERLQLDQEKIGKYIAGLCEQDFQKTKRIELLQAENQKLKEEFDRAYRDWCASDPQGNPPSSG